MYVPRRVPDQLQSAHCAVAAMPRRVHASWLVLDAGGRQEGDPINMLAPLADSVPTRPITYLVIGGGWGTLKLAFPPTSDTSIHTSTSAATLWWVGLILAATPSAISLLVAPLPQLGTLRCTTMHAAWDQHR